MQLVKTRGVRRRGEMRVKKRKEERKTTNIKMNRKLDFFQIRRLNVINVTKHVCHDYKGNLKGNKVS